ncbi:hypothetical protein RIB2604_03600010 [Aspergillus luchuensis]|uniref:Uncharacterized protein n=1 Tax=Aspergillus kawachii TaxID=1069201 RepID=A0A146G155_ASPKA|nr:hypothetical protein RIB2604_03600010 [Aspergillus luchuensis]
MGRIDKFLLYNSTYLNGTLSEVAAHCCTPNYNTLGPIIPGDSFDLRTISEDLKGFLD